MDAIDRVRIDGKTVVRTERTIDKGEPFYQLHYPFSETDFPGGPRTVCLALTLRMQQLAHAGARRRARPTHRGGVDKATIDPLAASIEILEPPEPVH